MNPDEAGPRTSASDAVAVVGAGLTGGSWAGLFAAAGLAVRIHDVDEARLADAAERAAAAARFLAANGLADPEAVERGIARLDGDRRPRRGASPA